MLATKVANAHAIIPRDASICIRFIIMKSRPFDWKFLEAQHN